MRDILYHVIHDGYEIQAPARIRPCSHRQRHILNYWHHILICSEGHAVTDHIIYSLTLTIYVFVRNRTVWNFISSLFKLTLLPHLHDSLFSAAYIYPSLKQLAAHFAGPLYKMYELGPSNESACVPSVKQPRDFVVDPAMWKLFGKTCTSAEVQNDN